MPGRWCNQPRLFGWIRIWLAGIAELVFVLSTPAFCQEIYTGADYPRMVVVAGRPFIVFNATTEEAGQLKGRILAAAARAVQPQGPQDWSTFPIRDNLDLGISDVRSEHWLALTSLGDTAACVFNYWGDSSSDPKIPISPVLACSRNATPQGPDDWSVAYGVMGQAFSEWHAIAAFEGKPLIADLPCSSGGQQELLRIAYPKIQDPVSENNFDHANIHSQDRYRASFTPSCSIAIVNQTPIIGLSSDALYIMYPESSEALLNKWRAVRIADYAPWLICLLSNEDNVDVIVASNSFHEFRLAQCRLTEIGDVTAWRWSTISNTRGGWIWPNGVVSINGHLAFVAKLYGRGSSYKGVYFVQAKVAIPASPSDWTFNKITSERYIDNLSLVEVNGVPAVSYNKAEGIYYAYAKCPDPRSSKDWITTAVYIDAAQEQHNKAEQVEKKASIKRITHYSVTILGILIVIITILLVSRRHLRHKR